VSTARAHTEWRNRTLAEYRSAAVTAQMLHWLIQAGAPQPLLDVALRIVGDELAHAQLSADVMEALGGSYDAEPVDVGTLAEPQAEEGLLASIVDSLLTNFLLGETLAVPLFDAMRRHTTHPAALAVLERVLRDEAVHRAFGWDVLDRLLEMDPDGVRARITSRLPDALAGFERAYGQVDGPPMTSAELEAGLLEYADWRGVFWRTIGGDVRRRLTQRGIDLPAAWLARVQSAAGASGGPPSTGPS
jgi:hypothetical protein